MARPTTSLPQPLSPSMRTVVVSDEPSRAIMERTCSIAADAADDRVERGPVPALARERRDLPARPRGRDRALHGRVERLERERLHEEVHRAVLHRLDRDVHRGVRGHHEHDEVGVRGERALQRLDAVDARQPDVEEHDVGRVRGEQLERLLAGLRREHLVAAALEALGDGPADELLVVDDEDAGGGGRHAACSVARGARASCRVTVNTVPPSGGQR